MNSDRFNEWLQANSLTIFSIAAGLTVITCFLYILLRAHRAEQERKEAARWRKYFAERKRSGRDR